MHMQQQAQNIPVVIVTYLTAIIELSKESTCNDFCGLKVEEVWKFIEDYQHSLAMMFFHS
jgi:hypothetical protein